MEYITEFDKDKFPWSKKARQNVDAINASPEADAIWSCFSCQWEGAESLPTRRAVDDCMKYWTFPEDYDGLRVYSSKEDFFVFKKDAFETISEKLEVGSPEDIKYMKIVKSEWPNEIQSKFLDFIGSGRDLAFASYKQFIMDYELQEDDEEECQGDEEE